MPQLHLSSRHSRRRPAPASFPQSEHVGAHQWDGMQLTFIFYIWVPFHIPFAFPLPVWDLAMLRGHPPVWCPTLRCLRTHQASSPVHIPSALTMSDKIWERIILATTNSTVILYGWFSTNVSFLFFSQLGKLNSIALAWVQTDIKIQTRLISASFTWRRDEGAQWNSA